MASNVFRGLGVALITPFKKDLSVDYCALRELVDYQIGHGADFLCVLGTTAETPCLKPEEKRLIRKEVVSTTRNRVPLLLGCGSNSTDEVMRQLQEDDFHGFDGLLSVCPYYNKPSQKGLYLHFRTIAEASPLPIVVYNVPGRTSVNLMPDTLLSLVDDCENIVAVKEASGNTDQIKDILKRKPTRFDVLSGDDALTWELVGAGAEGVISVVGNFFPGELKKMIALRKANSEASRTIHERFRELFRLMFLEGNPAGIKCLLSQKGLIENTLRLPLTPVGKETMSLLQEWVENSRDALAEIAAIPMPSANKTF